MITDEENVLILRLLETMKRILLVEDDEDIQEVLGLFLRSKGYQVDQYTHIHSLQYYLEQIKEKKPDLIISDIFIPEIDGRELCKFVKQQDDTKRIPYILISAGNFTKEEILNTCGDVFIAKPFDIGTIERTVEKFISAA